MGGGAKGEALQPETVEGIAANLGELNESQEVNNLLGLLRNGSDPTEVSSHLETIKQHLEQLRLLIRLANVTAEEVATGALLAEPDENGKKKPQQRLDMLLGELETELPAELQFVPQTITKLLDDHAERHGVKEIFTVEDTIDPKVTLEIGETPQRSCQHYENGGYNEGLIGYFGPEVKVAIRLLPN